MPAVAPHAVCAAHRSPAHRMRRRSEAGRTRPLGRFRPEGAFRAELLEARDTPVERPFGSPDLGRTLGDRLAEEDQRPDPLVLPLLLPGAQNLQLFPVFGALNAPPPAPFRPHASPREPFVGGKECYVRDFPATWSGSGALVVFCQASLQPYGALFVAESAAKGFPRVGYPPVPHQLGPRGPYAGVRRRAGVAFTEAPLPGIPKGERCEVPTP
ncbi:MAG: hypothetical protein AVDCRST_MAG01-01-3838 [uncultured Rubrobacteraceae bacterium]|uniref:Uncharacterized protein n=1 Tax=uncultured Rubrobacteraceae bacterium TaxID=349277 RepID=A0A6J4QK97_9ACTN|nr:MAG: hypothetical protein AVDCRST_MAG01-01-3838 [uncultured Rubrobacteraceae bacterium]